MARYILIDSDCGYIFGDSAELNGRVFSGTPAEFAEAMDLAAGISGRSYVEDSLDGKSGYHVYLADVEGSETVPVVEDGQDKATIANVKQNCEYIMSLKIVEDRE